MQQGAVTTNKYTTSTVKITRFYDVKYKKNVNK